MILTTNFFDRPTVAVAKDLLGKSLICRNGNAIISLTINETEAAAILIRGAGQFCGPGKSTRALSIDNRFNKKVALPRSGLWFENSGIVLKKEKIVATPRIGVGYAGDVWANKPYRFVYR
jgi:DNA-3-methyladenine glycosylase